MAERGQFLPGTPHPSVSEVIRLVKVELCELLARREEVARQVRNLQVTISAFKKFAEPPLAVNRTAEAKCFVDPVGDDRPDAAELRSLRLRRACRIALLESDGPISLREIFCRIVRRGSFSLVNGDSAQPAIFRELIALHQAGEVLRSGSGLNSRWQLFSRETE